MSAGRLVPKVAFDSPPTVAELLDALEDLRAAAGPDAIVRFLGVVEFNLNGCRVASVSAERPSAAPR